MTCSHEGVAVGNSSEASGYLGPVSFGKSTRAECYTERRTGDLENSGEHRKP